MLLNSLSLSLYLSARLWSILPFSSVRVSFSLLVVLQQLFSLHLFLVQIKISSWPSVLSPPINIFLQLLFATPKLATAAAAASAHSFVSSYDVFDSDVFDDLITTLRRQRRR